jgi:hypothetical protein
MSPSVRGLRCVKTSLNNETRSLFSIRECSASSLLVLIGFMVLSSTEAAQRPELLLLFVFDAVPNDFRRISRREISDKYLMHLAPRAGFEPATNRLTAGCSTAELPGTNAVCAPAITKGLSPCQA